MNKKNTFNDFVDATDYLVREHWGAADKVFASGGSAGGLLMGVVANESRHALPRGIVLDVPFVDARDDDARRVDPAHRQRMDAMG